MKSVGFFTASRFCLGFIPALIHLVFFVSMLLLQGCYQASSPSVPRQAVDSLVALLADRDWVVRRTAAEALGKIGDPSTAPLMEQRLDDAVPEVREAIARSLGRLGRIGTDAGRRLSGLLIDSNQAVRSAAAQAVGAAETDGEVLPGIVTALADSNPGIRATASYALLGLATPGVSDELVLAMLDKEAPVRQGAVAALGDQADDRVVALLIDRLKNDGNANVRAEAAYRLGFHGEVSVASALEATIKHDSSAQVRRWAQQSLAGLRTIGGSDSTPRQGQ